MEQKERTGPAMNKRPPLRRSAPVEQENDGIIEGRNAVIEA